MKVFLLTMLPALISGHNVAPVYTAGIFSTYAAAEVAASQWRWNTGMFDYYEDIKELEMDAMVRD